MIEDACRIYGLARIEAKTDRDAVGFHRQCGFAVPSLGERYPGVGRFRCAGEESSSDSPLA
jgi:hypothetical protein